jgi:hypothetical protein
VDLAFGFEESELGLDEARHLRFLGRRPANTKALDHDFLQHKLTNKTAITEAAAMAVVASLLAFTPQSPKKKRPQPGGKLRPSRGTMPGGGPAQSGCGLAPCRCQ